MKHPHAALAAKLSAMGRNGDVTLLHVSEDELRGIASLGKLTVNPKTGLLEAFSLGNLLPIAAAVASEYFFPGNPWASAAFAGGTNAIQGGSMQSILSHAALAGGSSSLFGSMAGQAGVGAEQLAGPGMDGIPDAAVSAGAGAAAGEALSPWEAMKAKAGNFADNLGKQDMSSLGKFAADNKMGLGLTAGGAMGLASTLAGQQQAALMDQRVKAQRDAEQQRLAGIKQGPSGETMMDPQTMYDTYSARFAPKPYAGGGIVSLAGGGLAPLPGMATEIARRRSATEFIRNTYPDIVHARMDLRNPDSPLLKLGIKGPNDPLLTAAFAGGGGEVQGPGDGTSDSIPAVIDGKQPAALSAGEFVVPARHVSALGNGSTKAGSSKLHAMLDRINAQAGMQKKGGSVNDEALPA